MEQQENLTTKLINNLPNNLLLVGPRYSGKKTLINEIAPDFYWVEGSVDVIRELQSSNLIFADIDDWANACYSAMLTLLEENEEHMILTCKNLMNIPTSIQTRCIIEKMPVTPTGYCDYIGQVPYYSENMLNAIDKYEYEDEFDFDVYFTVLCNRLLERVTNGEPLEKELLISSKYNSAKNLKSLNKKQFIYNWKMDLLYNTENWKRL